jgi:two-component sensor histidine kinase
MDSYPGPFGQVLTHPAVNAITYAFDDNGKRAIDVKAEEEISSHFKECNAISSISAKENSVGGPAT